MEKLQALCVLSDSHGRLNPEELTHVIEEAPDPSSAVSTILNYLPGHSEVLGRTWRKVVFDLWSEQHPHIPLLLDLPITSTEVLDVPAIQDALYALRQFSRHPGQLQREGSEWLLTPDDAYDLASNLPSRRGHPLIPLENEWQSLRLRRLRTTLQALRLLRRQQEQLVVVKSRYQRFLELPASQQYYLLWHTDVYHTNWAQFGSIWGEYLNVIQACVPLLWDLSEAALPNVSYHIRRWNQDIWDTFAPLWDHEGLLSRRQPDSILLSFVRTQSVPYAVTQVVMRDLLEHYGLVVNEGEHYHWTPLGTRLTAAERTQEMPCALDLLK
ncbi:MAG TPA: hypothetical protein VJC05_00030 [Candidatus Andersenbacteria bacterium]|nr:hypothetical protein [Candidatus Andersenbacteria bacterium]